MGCEWRKLDEICAVVRLPVQLGGRLDSDTMSATLKNNDLSTPLIMISPASGLEAQSQLGTFNIGFKKIRRIDMVGKEYLQGEVLAIAKHLQMAKMALPQSIEIDNPASLKQFASQHLKLKLKENKLKVTTYNQYIIIHFNDAEHENNNPKWKIRKFGEAVVIDTARLTFAAFHLSKT
ncbi:MAG: hypothetical protein GY814_14095 [Gammaproteobacteria bacterium]|nr:hypothetical protein [Gammaproteobacteria bacterium]